MRYRFENFVLDPLRRELTRGAEPIAVGPQVFDVLLHLVGNRAQVVSKDGLLDAVWKGRIVSESTLTSHINAARKAISDNGQEQRLIRTIARKGFLFVGDVTEVDPANASDPDPHPDQGAAARPSTNLATNLAPDRVLALPDRASIAVLPFLNLSGEPAQDYFVDGVVEDITGALSRMKWLFVIARNSSFTYKGRAVDVKQVGRELGVRYILEGSLRKAATRVRITGQLVDAATAVNLWSERFEGNIDDIFALQDELTSSVVGAIVPQLERAEIERALRKHTEKLDAYDYYLRGMASFHLGNRGGMSAALPLFQTAIERDPDFASAYALAAACHFWSRFNGWAGNSKEFNAEGARLTRLAVDLGKDDPVALARGGHALANFVGDLDAAVALIDRALAINQNFAAAWFLGSFVRIMRGEYDVAIAHLGHSMRLSPLDPETYRIQGGTALAHLCAGRYDEAAAWAERALRGLPSFLIVVCILAASCALSGRADEAQRAMQNARRLDPALRVSKIKDWLLFHRPENVAVLTEGLRRAGLPE
jgi:TolB-like protein